jgi:aminoglycoside/choline kinase family phosphotransferase
LRDFHSPNLLWLPRRSEIARLGILDFQDAVMGPPAYDLASLLQDARVDVPEQMELDLLGRYVRGRRQGEPDFNPTDFIKTYVTVAAQRASKILGIFARLDVHSAILRSNRSVHGISPMCPQSPRSNRLESRLG